MSFTYLGTDFQSRSRDCLLNLKFVQFQHRDQKHVESAQMDLFEKSRLI